MSPSILKTLNPGMPYRVRIKGGRRSIRIFKWSETRQPFGILCAVFTSRVQGPLQVTVVDRRTLRFSGRHIPVSELSVPHYDLIECASMKGASM